MEPLFWSGNSETFSHVLPWSCDWYTNVRSPWVAGPNQSWVKTYVPSAMISMDGVP